MFTVMKITGQVGGATARALLEVGRQADGDSAPLPSVAGAGDTPRSSSMQIRTCKPEEVATLMNLVRRMVPSMRAGGNLQWDEDYPNAEVFQQDVAAAQLWVAEIAGRISGFAAITTDQSPEYAEVGWNLQEPAVVVHRLAVDPAWRGRGIAAALMAQAEVVARGRGIGVLRVDTNTENAATQKLFPKLGYVLAGEIRLGFRPGLRFLCYEKRLRPSGQTPKEPG